jgi:hypothetical protein
LASGDVMEFQTTETYNDNNNNNNNNNNNLFAFQLNRPEVMIKVARAQRQIKQTHTQTKEM